MRLWQYIVLALLLLSVPAGVAFAGHITEGINRIPIFVINATGIDQRFVQVPLNLSSHTLVGGAFMDVDALDTDVLETDHVGYMPGTGQVQMLACFNPAGADETVTCNNIVPSVTLPATGSEAYEFAGDNQFRILHLNISTAAVADWTITWEYWNGSAYVALSGVTDGTDHFQNSGTSRVTWDFPALGLWPASTLHAIEGYWVRARVSAATSVTTPPVGTQVWYETGRWWVFAESIADATSEQKRFDVHLDVSGIAASESFEIGTGVDDGIVTGAGGGYPPGFNSVRDNITAEDVSRLFAGGTFVIRDVLLRFDTSALPDSMSPSSAELQCHVVSKSNVDSRDLVAEWYNWESVSEANYLVDANNDAISGVDIDDITTGAVNSWELDNLHLISKSGTTGLRLSISGAEPAGDNNIVLAMVEHTTAPPCTLAITYDGTREYHNYFPHFNGYTVADAAALEPGEHYEISILGYFELAATGTDLFLSKGTDLEIGGFVSSETVLRINRNGGASTLTPSANRGYHLLQVRQGTSGDLQVLYDGEVIDSDSRLSITDNASDWEFWQNGGTSYVEYIQIKVGNDVVLFHQLRDLPDHAMINQANPGTFDATARYPDTIAGFTISLGSTEATTPAGGVQPAPGPEVLGEVPAIEGFTEIPQPDGDSFWLFSLMGSALPTAGLYTFMVSAFAIAGTIGLTILAARVFKAALIVGIVTIVVLVIFWRMGAVPGWLPWLFGLGPMIFFLVWKRLNP